MLHLRLPIKLGQPATSGYVHLKPPSSKLHQNAPFNKILVIILTFNPKTPTPHKDAMYLLFKLKTNQQVLFDNSNK